MEDPVYNFRKPLAELEEIPEVVQRLSSLSYANGQALKYHRLEEMHDRIADLFGSNASQEQRIAKLTVQIRTLLPHCFYFRKDKKVKSQLVEKIQMRRKLLKNLRKQDHEHFLWLLKELKIKYMPIADYHGRVTRRYKRKTTIRNKAMVVREQKLAALRTRLEAERTEFEMHKEKVLVQIEKDIAELDLDRDYYAKLQLRRPMTKLEAAEISRRQKPASGM